VVEANIHDDATLRRLLEGRTAAINLVGILHSSRGSPTVPSSGAPMSNCRAASSTPAHAAGVPRYLHMSALGADVDGPSMYSRSKADGELAARSHPEVAATIFRPSVVFGPGDHFLTMFAKLQRMPAGGAAGLRLGRIPAGVRGRRRHRLPARAARPARHRTRSTSWADRTSIRWPSWCAWPDAMPAANAHHRAAPGLARLQARIFELLPGEPLLTRDNLDSMKVDNVLDPASRT
jgi:uncharacterized protein YbjT (DUF2867 family)